MWMAWWKKSADSMGMILQYVCNWIISQPITGAISLVMAKYWLLMRHSALRISAGGAAMI